MTKSRTILIAASLALVLVLQASATSHAAHYVVTDLGALGGNTSLGWGINDRGQVTGYAGTPGAAIDGFLWNPTTPHAAMGAMYDLGSLGGSFSWGIGINSGGQVAGVSATPEDAAEHATLWIPTSPNGPSGTLHDIGTLGGTYSQGTGINASGQVTGYSDLAGDEAGHAIMWKPTTPGDASGVMHDLGSLGGTNSFGWDINASGQVCGSSDTTGDDATHPFLWNPTALNGVGGALHDLGTLGGSWGEAGGINESGQVAGSSFNQDEASRAFLWTPANVGGASGTMLDLGTLGGSDSYGYAVNAAGQVVGLSYVAPEVSNYSHAFLYTPNSGMIDLNTMINPLSGWELLDSDDINDLGQVTGQGLFNGEYRAYLLTPATLLDGDFNGDGSVNSADLTNWQAGFGTSSDATHLAGDADGDLDVDGADFLAWQRQLGSPSCAPATAAVPEPATLLSLVLAMSAIILRRRVAVTSTHASMTPVPAGRYSEYGRQKGCAIARPGRTDISHLRRCALSAKKTS